jgi:hypothetical protein
VSEYRNSPAAIWKRSSSPALNDRRNCPDIIPALAGAAETARMGVYGPKRGGSRQAQGSGKCLIACPLPAMVCCILMRSRGEVAALVLVVLSLWISSPLAAQLVNTFPSFSRREKHHDEEFLRGISLRLAVLRRFQPEGESLAGSSGSKWRWRLRSPMVRWAQEAEVGPTQARMPVLLLR